MLKRYYTRIRNWYYRARRNALTWREMKKDIIPCFGSDNWMVIIARRIGENGLNVRNYHDAGLSDLDQFRILETAIRDIGTPDTLHEITEDGRKRIVKIQIEVNDD